MSQVKGLCVMDVDGTLIAEEVIDLLGREALLKGLPISVLDTVFKSIHLSRNAQEFISLLKKNDILVGLVSGGFSPIVDRLAKYLGISYFSANELEVKDGFLTGKLVGEIVTAQVKQATLEKWRKELELPKERTIAIGDGANDLLMLKSAGHAIAFCAKEVVKAEIACQVDKREFLEILPLLDFLE